MGVALVAAVPLLTVAQPARASVEDCSRYVSYGHTLDVRTGSTVRVCYLLAPDFPSGHWAVAGAFVTPSSTRAYQGDSGELMVQIAGGLCARWLWPDVGTCVYDPEVHLGAATAPYNSTYYGTGAVVGGDTDACATEGYPWGSTLLHVGTACANGDVERT
ncbi:MAG: hypothetical protein M3394_01315 [Actinomycetota bacterium]|nr:hypothetical protein [Actinomycetota bacterium]